MKISVVIPALNEEGIVGKTIKSIPVDEFKEAGYDYEIIVINNDSTDNTAQEASDAGATVFLEKNRGYGNAYIRGFKEATGDIIIMGDADGTYPLEQSMDFVNIIVNEDCDFVIGSRFDGTIEKGAMPALHQYIGNPMLTKMLNLFFNSNYSDTHCGMRAFTREAIEATRDTRPMIMYIDDDGKIQQRTSTRSWRDISVEEADILLQNNMKLIDLQDKINKQFKDINKDFE
jgi:glycosyltransferase involved in cell wall biosynthesis